MQFSVVYSLPKAQSLAGDLLWQRAKELESQFLAEMLRHSGLSKPPESFGGGQGEEQFSSFLRAAYAEALSVRAGIGLAEQIFQSLRVAEHDAHS